MAYYDASTGTYEAELGDAEEMFDNPEPELDDDFDSEFEEPFENFAEEEDDTDLNVLDAKCPKCGTPFAIGCDCDLAEDG